MNLRVFVKRDGKAVVSQGCDSPASAASAVASFLVGYPPPNYMIEVVEDLPPATRIQRIANLRFPSTDLNRETTILEWMKTLLLTLFQEEEGFSGKRPLGNSSWKADAEAALIQAGLLNGKLDSEGYIEECADSMPIFVEVISALETPKP